MLNKEKYNLRQMDISTKTKDGKILFFNLKIRGKTIHQQIYPCGVFACDAMREMIGWLEEEYVPEILTEKEKAYLSAVIKPFRKDVECIEKVESYYGENEFIHITMKKDYDYCELPAFEKGTMYKGMEVNKAYTLEELGL
ncbi:hypothetical protein [Solobacterium moorei]|uniref:hypothetical protein n=1 Tax=Solobacterium moorei TaxID=102148 RepID=UPI000409F673|nr:hypothetical protein [Solobacterium moorei]BET21285.1 hypothetical protein RGT18_08730 [Solobacterium moorei]